MQKHPLQRQAPAVPCLYTGTSGLVLPVANKQFFPPAFRKASRLTYYASLLNSLEVNSSFYKIPMAKTVSRWATEVPDDFRFTFKLFKDITHNKILTLSTELVERFMHVIDGAGAKKGALLIQFPPGLGLHIPYLKKLLQVVNRNNPAPAWNISVEFRHPSWYTHDTYDLLEHFNACMVIHDMPKSATPATDLWTSFAYLRFHGPAGDYKGGYTDPFLAQQAAVIQDWIDAGKTVYVYFNNTIGAAISNVFTLNSFLQPGI